MHWTALLSLSINTDSINVRRRSPAPRGAPQDYTPISTGIIQTPYSETGKLAALHGKPCKKHGSLDRTKRPPCSPPLQLPLMHRIEPMHSAAPLRYLPRRQPTTLAPAPCANAHPDSSGDWSMR